MRLTKKNSILFLTLLCLQNVNAMFSQKNDQTSAGNPSNIGTETLDNSNSSMSFPSLFQTSLNSSQNQTSSSQFFLSLIQGIPLPEKVFPEEMIGNYFTTQQWEELLNSESAASIFSSSFKKLKPSKQQKSKSTKNKIAIADQLTDCLTKLSDKKIILDKELFNYASNFADKILDKLIEIAKEAIAIDVKTSTEQQYVRISDEMTIETERIRKTKFIKIKENYEKAFGCELSIFDEGSMSKLADTCLDAVGQDQPALGVFVAVDSLYDLIAKFDKYWKTLECRYVTLPAALESLGPRRDSTINLNKEASKVAANALLEKQQQQKMINQMKKVYKNSTDGEKLTAELSNLSLNTSDPQEKDSQNIHATHVNQFSLDQLNTTANQENTNQNSDINYLPSTNDKTTVGIEQQILQESLSDKENHENMLSNSEDQNLMSQSHSDEDENNQNLQQLSSKKKSQEICKALRN